MKGRGNGVRVGVGGMRKWRKEEMEGCRRNRNLREQE